MIFYFSGTGNSAWAAKNLSQTLEEKLYSIPKEMQQADNSKEDLLSYFIEPDECVGFVFPVYSWGPPPRTAIHSTAKAR